VRRIQEEKGGRGRRGGGKVRVGVIDTMMIKQQWISDDGCENNGDWR